MKFCVPFILFLSLNLHAQKIPGVAPFPATLNCRKLSEWLTSGLPDDSSKIRSIYLWETRHIKYDVKNYSRGRPSYDTPKKILRHRRAVCLGYSILFDSLCYYAGIRATMVPGYVRPPWYEPKDTLYLDDHAWNVVEMNGEWKLMDVTWASGYVEPKKQIFRKVMYLLIRYPFYQKYKFHRKRNDLYYNTDPAFFILEHLPSAPAWQMLECTVPKDSFQLSPASVENALKGGMPVCHHGKDTIPKIMAEPKCRQQLEMGKEAMHFNKNNRQDLAIGYVYYAYYLYPQAECERIDKPSRIIFYDSTAHQIDSAAKAFAKASTDAKEELNFLLRRNRRFVQMVATTNKQLLNRHGDQRKELWNEYIATKKLASNTRMKNKKLHTLASQIENRSLRITRPKLEQPEESAERKQIMREIDANDHLIDSLLILSRNYKLQDHLSSAPADDTLLVRLYEGLRYVTGLEWGLINLRRFGLFNNYDTIMLNVMGMREMTEQRMFELHNRLVHPANWNEVKVNASYNVIMNSVDSLTRINMDLCQQLGKMSQSEIDESWIFEHQKTRYLTWRDSLYEQNRLLNDAYLSYAHYIREMKHVQKVLVRRLHKEINADKARSAMTNASLRHYYGGIFSSFRISIHRCIKLRAHCRYKSTILKKEVATEERKLKKEEK